VPFGPWPGVTPGQLYLSELYALGIVDDPPSGAFPNTLEGDRADIFFSENGRLVVTDNDVWDGFSDLNTMARWRKRENAGLISGAFSERTILYTTSLGAGSAWLDRWMGRRIVDETQTFLGMEQGLLYSFSPVIGWPGAFPIGDNNVRELRWRIPNRGSSSFDEKIMFTGDGTLFQFGVNVPPTDAPEPPQYGLIGDTLVNSLRGNRVLRTGEGGMWLVRLASDEGGQPEAGAWSVEWLNAAVADLQSSYSIRVRTGETGADGEVIFRGLTVDGASIGEGDSARFWRAWGLLNIAGPSVVEVEMGRLQWEWTDNDEAAATSRLRVFLQDDGGEVEAATIEPAAATFAGELTIGADAAAVQFQRTFDSGPLDLTMTHADVPLVPARAGYFPVMQARNWVINSFAGTQSTPATVRAGSDAGHTNFIASTATTPSNAEVNGAAPPSLAGGPGFPALTTQRIPGTAVLLDVPTAATGVGFALTATLVVQVAWFPYP
jgi:hypothetical protein